ncbi:hypothetical protein EVAR_78092_1 [Eumeta japonica]|uniref:Uncharacterized protein n=1 Tax=Eumeta variegata TaxID=151549 RepID=A0A4C1T3B5_EUMVA|nr:hypothetical protein EVAR_78092_1 [Eumeta japonica]
MMETCFKRRPNRGRTIIFLLMICDAFAALVLSGLSHLDYFYVRGKFQWSLEAYSVYRATGTVVLVIGIFFGVVLMQKVLKISDIHLVLLSYLSAVADYAIKAFAVMSWHMYLGSDPGVGIPLMITVIGKPESAQGQREEVKRAGFSIDQIDIVKDIAYRRVGENFFFDKCHEWLLPSTGTSGIQLAVCCDHRRVSWRHLLNLCLCLRHYVCDVLKTPNTLKPRGWSTHRDSPMAPACESQMTWGERIT